MNVFIEKMAILCYEHGMSPEDWMWFDMSGQINGSMQCDPTGALSTYRPPFPLTIIAMRSVRDGGTYDIVVGLKGEDPETGIQVALMINHNDSTPRFFDPFTYLIRDGRLHVDGKESLADEQIRKGTSPRIVALQTLSFFYERLAQTAVPCHHPTIEKTFLNQRRIEKGKAPKYTWHTLIVGAETVVRDDLGGTHASPRYHDRRGHQRRLKNGKVIWVKACKVGDPSKGAVFKDYAVRTLQ
jgi:hypothetical protein